MKISISSTIQECDNVTTPYYAISALLSVNGSLTGGENQPLALKVGMVSYERWLLTKGPNKCIVIDEENFGSMENWLLRRGGSNWRFHYILEAFTYHCIMANPFK